MKGPEQQQPRQLLALFQTPLEQLMSGIREKQKAKATGEGLPLLPD
jgi:hypothetical protein